MKVMSSIWIRHLLITASSFVVVAMITLLVLNVSFLNPIGRALENFSVIDLYFQMLAETNSRASSRAVTIVDMSALNMRRDIADVIDHIEQYNPVVLGVDIVFEGIKEDTIGDSRIMDQAERYNNIVYSCKSHRDNEGSMQEVHSFFTPFIDVKEGIVNFQRDLYAGIKRYMQTGFLCDNGLRPSFVFQIANNYAKQQVAPLSEKQLLINFTPKHFERLSYDSISKYPDLIENRIVLLGATKEENDMHYTPLGKMSGVELQAYAIDMLVNKQYVKKVPTALLLLISVLLVLIVEVIQNSFLEFADHLRRPIPRFLLSTEMAVSILTFIIMAMLLSVSFHFFRWFGIFINLGWAFSAMAFLHLNRQLYDTCQHIIKTHSS